MLSSIGMGSAVMCISAVINSIVSQRPLQSRKKLKNLLPLEVMHFILKTDVYTSLVLHWVGLILITEYVVLIPVVAISVALYYL